MSNKDYSRDEYNKNYYNNKNAKNIEGDSKDVINDDINELIQNEELDDTYVNGKYKDCVFRMLFNSKEKLLELYNGLNCSHYTDTNNLKINTLSDAVYMGYKNDVSFVFNSYMYLFEHQSTYSPNLPLRNLIYVSRLLEKETKDDILYNKRFKC